MAPVYMDDASDEWSDHAHPIYNILIYKEWGIRNGIYRDGIYRNGCGIYPMYRMNGAMNIYGDECDIGDRDILGGGGQPRA